MKLVDLPPSDASEAAEVSGATTATIGATAATPTLASSRTADYFCIPANVVPLLRKIFDALPGPQQNVGFDGWLKDAAGLRSPTDKDGVLRNLEAVSKFVGEYRGATPQVPPAQIDMSAIAKPSGQVYKLVAQQVQLTLLRAAGKEVSNELDDVNRKLGIQLGKAAPSAEFKTSYEAMVRQCQQDAIDGLSFMKAKADAFDQTGPSGINRRWPAFDQTAVYDGYKNWDDDHFKDAEQANQLSWYTENGSVKTGGWVHRELNGDSGDAWSKPIGFTWNGDGGMGFAQMYNAGPYAFDEQWAKAKTKVVDATQPAWVADLVQTMKTTGALGISLGSADGMDAFKTEIYKMTQSVQGM